MRLVVDTNVIISALVRDSTTRRLILHLDAELFTIGFSREELLPYRKDLLRRSRLDESTFDAVLESLFSKLTVIDDRLVRSHLEKAKTIMDAIDPDDTLFIAAALAIGATSGQMTNISGNRQRLRFGKPIHWSKATS